jgi:PKD repeat protein
MRLSFLRGAVSWLPAIGVSVLLLVVLAPVGATGPRTAPGVPAGLSPGVLHGSASSVPRSSVRAAPHGALSTGWTLVGSNIGPSRGTPALAYDAADGYVLAFGGGGDVGASYNDTWTYSAGTWTNITAKLTTAPGPREAANMVYDAAMGRILLFGGYTNQGLSYGNSYVVNDTWTYLNGTWTNITAAAGTAPPGTYTATMAYDAADQEDVLFGGGVTTASGIGAGLTSITWIFQNGTWTNITSSITTSPPPRDQASMAYDARDGYVVLFGGKYGLGELNDTWKFVGNRWTQIAGPTSYGSYVGVPSPPDRRGGMLAFDTAADYLVLTEGENDSCFYGPCIASDTWAFFGGAWTDLTAQLGSAPSPARWEGGISDDPADDQVVLLGGCVQYGCYLGGGNLNDSWEFSGTPLSVSLEAAASIVDANATMQFDTLAWGGTFPYTYHYSPLPPGCSSQNVTSLTCIPTTAGTYPVNVSVTDEVGTVVNATATLRVIGPLTGSLSTSLGELDVGQTVQLTVVAGGGANPYSYTYSGLPTGCATSNHPVLNCTPTAAGNFTPSVTIRDQASGQLVAGPVAIAVAPALTSLFTANPTPLDVGTNLTLTAALAGGFGTDVITWTGLPTGCSPADVAVLHCAPTTAGVFDADVSTTDGSGFPSTAPLVLITVNPTLRASIQASQIYGIAPLAVQFSSGTTGGTPTFSYAWSLGDGTTSVLSGPGHTYGAPGNYSITLAVTDAVGGIAHANVTVQVVAPLSTTLTTSSTVTDVALPVTYTAAPAGGATPYTYAWTGLPPGCASSNSAQIVCTPTSSGPFTVTVTVADRLGEHASSHTSVTVNPALSITTTYVASTTCAGPFGANFTTRVLGGTSPYAFFWTFGDGTDSNGSAPIHPYAKGGNYSATLTVTDALKANGTSTVTVSVGPSGCPPPSNGNPASSSPSTLELVALGVVALAIVAALAVMLMRRRRRPPAPEDEAPAAGEPYLADPETPATPP